MQEINYFNHSFIHPIIHTKRKHVVIWQDINYNGAVVGNMSPNRLPALYAVWLMVSVFLYWNVFFLGLCKKIRCRLAAVINSRQKISHCHLVYLLPRLSCELSSQHNTTFNRQCPSNIYIAPIVEGRIWGAGVWVTRRDRLKRKGEI